MGGFDLLVTGRSHFLLSERWLSFNNVMITLKSARSSARIVELASGDFHQFNFVLVTINRNEICTGVPMASDLFCLGRHSKRVWFKTIDSLFLWVVCYIVA